MPHTPGPWITFMDRSSGEDKFDILPAMRGGEIAADIRNSADATLIAAAPDMLNALLASRRYVESLEGLLDPTIDEGAPTIREHATMVRAAIAKATGTTK